mgnify:FL=1
MKKLLSMELKRAFLSPVLWIGVITEICINVYAIISSTYGFAIYTTSFLFEHSGLLCIMIAIFISLHISHDFEVRTINNKIAAGYSRKQIYLTEVVTSAICSSFLFIADIIIVFICSLIKHLEFSNRVTYTAFIINMFINLICIITISSLFTMLVMIAHKQLISLAIVLLLTLAMLSFGGNTVSSLCQDKTWTDPVTHETEKNPLYIHGFKRTAANLQLLISPFAQVKYEPFMLLEETSEKAANSLLLKKVPYHFEFCIFNLLELVFFCKIGIAIFKKQDLK